MQFACQRGDAGIPFSYWSGYSSLVAGPEAAQPTAQPAPTAAAQALRRSPPPTPPHLQSCPETGAPAAPAPVPPRCQTLLVPPGC